MKNFTLFQITLIFAVFVSWQTSYAQPSPTDCILDAPDITSFIEDGVSIENHGWACSDPGALPVIGTSATNTPDAATGGANSGPDMDFTITRKCNTGNDTPIDVWYKFSPTGALDAWVDLYRGTTNGDDMVIELFEETATLGGDCTGSITGTIVYMGCSDQGAGQFAERERATCTGLSGERIDISGLIAGTTYYLRIYEWGADASPDADIDFGLCAERSTPIGPAVDNCNNLDALVAPAGLIEASTGCANTPAAGRDVTISYFNQSNGGSFGNDASGFVDNNLALPCPSSEYASNSTLASPTPGTAIKDVGCDNDSGNDNAGVVLNNVLNNNIMYAFRVSVPDCDPTNNVKVTLSFTNLEAFPAGGAIQGTVMGPLPGTETPPANDVGACENASPTVFTFSHVPDDNNCFSISNADDFIAGTFIVMIEGSNGTLVKWDLIVDIDYQATCADAEPDCDLALGGGTVGASALAVDLTGFAGRAEKMGNQLEWMTASEKDHHYFDVERALDAKNFINIGRIDAMGDANEPQRYAYFDSDAPSVAYYRLKLVDMNDKHAYSRTILINRKSEDLSINSVFPMPVLDEASISFQTATEGKAQITLTDVNGRIVEQRQVNTVEGENIQQFNLSQAATGVYFATIEFNNQQLVQRIIKQ